MPLPDRIVQLSEDPDGSVLYLSDCISLGEGQRESWETVTRVVNFEDDYYGEVNITRAKLNQMVKNFDSGIYGQDIFIDVAHRPDNGSAGEIKQLKVEQNKLRAKIDWTEYGVDAVTKKGFRYFSADFHENYKDPESGKKHGVLLRGAGLTTRPRVKRLDPIDPTRLQLSFDNDHHYLVSPRVMNLLSEEIKTMKGNFLKLLTEALNKIQGLTDDAITQLSERFSKALEGITEEAQAQILLAAFTGMGEDLGKQLAETGHNAGAIQLDFSGLQTAMSGMGAGSSGLSKDDVLQLMEDEQKKAATKLAETETNRKANIKQFTDAIDGQDGFSDALKKQLCERVDDLITADMTETQIKALSENAIAMGNQVSAQARLSGLGFEFSAPSGRVHIDMNTREDGLKLQEQIDGFLKRTSHHANGKIHLSEKTSQFVGEVLANFDTLHAARIHAESKQLAGGETGIADTNLPVGVQRTVIREALSDLRVLELVQALTDPGAQGTTQIPYETRDITDVNNDGVVYEGNPIHRASVSQEMDLAYILPMKLAFLISNEVMHFTRANMINWDAYARNVESNARVMRELVVRRLSNELQRAADAYGSVDITAEAFDAQLTGANSIIKTVNYPIVRPHQQRDMKGTAVGSVENPITITLNGVAITEYDGTGAQAAGTYWRIANANLGYIQLVNELGVAQTPADTGVNTIDYSYATNVTKFDTDLGTDTKAVHWNGFLQAVGARKAILAQDRFEVPDFMLMSFTLNNDATDAENFTAQARRDGAATTSMGDLESIKALPAYSTNAPGIDLGEERCLIGQRGTLSYTIAKPFSTSEPFEAVDANGKAIGKKQAYGEEYSAMKVPTPIRGRLTSVIAYSFTTR